MSTETVTNEHVQRAVATLHQRRLEAAAASAAIAARRAAWEEQHAVAIEEERKARERLAEADAMVRQLGLAHFEATGEAKPGYGVSVILTDKTAIVDEEAAFAWAKASGTGLTLDRKALEKAAKAGLVIPGVEVDKEPAVRIASDLAEFLVEAPVAAGEGA